MSGSGFRVEVSVWGEPILSIEEAELSGAENIRSFDRPLKDAADHLASFLGGRVMWPEEEEFDAGAPIETRDGILCGLCDSSLGCKHPALVCRKCSERGLYENMQNHKCGGV